MLLGQAESGKSTLQKQFQLYYASQSLDYEKPSWRPVVYFNIIKAVRMILNELDYEFSSTSSTPPPPPQPEGGEETEVSNFNEDAAEIQERISCLRQKLCPLIAIEDPLAFELNGGISVTGGRRDIFVRAGWQALVSSTTNRSKSGVGSSPSSTVTLASKTLFSLKGDIAELWANPAVKALVRLRRLRLDDGASLYVLFSLSV